MDFSGKVAVVNGATRGLGASIAMQLAGKGATVVITGRTKEQGDGVVKLIEESGGVAMFHQMDATKEIEICKMHEAVVSKFGGFDLAVNNLGVEDTPPVHLKDSSEEAFDHCVSIKAKSAFLGMKHQINHFIDGKKPGAIVNVSSMIGLGGHANVPAYSAANGAVQALTKSAAVEVAKDNIRINCICPSAIKGSPMLRRFTGNTEEGHKGYLDVFEAKYPMGRIGDADEVAQAALFLLSGSASYITGHNSPVDGGYSMSLM